jgi:hypothetical protein
MQKTFRGDVPHYQGEAQREKDIPKSRQFLERLKSQTRDRLPLLRNPDT